MLLHTKPLGIFIILANLQSEFLSQNPESSYLVTWRPNKSGVNLKQMFISLKQHHLSTLFFFNEKYHNPSNVCFLWVIKCVCSAPPHNPAVQYSDKF